MSTFIAVSDCFSDNGITPVPSCTNDAADPKIVRIKLGVAFNVGAGNVIALKNRIQNPKENGLEKKFAFIFIIIFAQNLEFNVNFFIQIDFF